MNKPYIVKLFILSIVVFGLAACGGGGGGGSDSTAPTSTSRDVTGGGVKGPLANAIVTVYAYDPGQADFKGAVAASATTDNSAAITGLALPFPVSPPYILEFTSDAGTSDITTGVAPVIGTMRTVITQALLDTGEQIYATPLTTMAVDIAIANSNAATTAAQFETALTAAAVQVVSTVGFGMPADIDIFDTPPLVDSTTVTTGEQSDVSAYRSAVEALTAVVFAMEQQSSGDVDAVLSELSMDLVDGNIDGMVSGSASTVFSSTTLDVLAQDPSTLIIPNTAQTVANVQDILVAETATTGSTTSTTELDTGGSITTTTEPAETNPDIDADGTLNVDDAFPEDASEIADSDGDGLGDNADPDDDNDGILDVDEGITPAPTGTDVDGDGFDDGVDLCPVNFNPAQTNTDGLGDGGDACDTDDDEDGALDTADAFPLDVNEQSDADNDGTGDIADTDDDNDGIDDTTEDGSGASADHDSDGTPNREDTDSDNDGVLDGVDFDSYNNLVTFNLAPVTADSGVSTNEDVAVAVVLDVTDDGVASGALTYSITGPTSGVLSGTEPNLTYTPNAEFSGSDSFTFTATDGDGEVSNLSTVSITVIVDNDAPVIAQVGPLAVAMDEDGSPTAFVAPTITATDIDSGTLTWTGTAASNGTATVSGTGASPTITYVPNGDFNGADSFDVMVSDGSGGSDVITVNVTVNPVNDAPVIAQVGPFVVNMDEDSSPAAFVAPTITASDIDSGTLTWTGTVASNGTATVSGTGASPTITYVPNGGFNGVDSFDVTVNDGSGGSDVITINVAVAAQNDAPVIAQVGPLAVAMDEDGSPTAFVAPTITATDIDSGTLTWTGTAASNGAAMVSGTGASPTITYVPNGDFNGADSFDVAVSDGTGGSDVISVNVTVAAQNDLPTIGGTPPTTAVDGILYSFTPTANDVDGQALSFSIQNQPSWATTFNTTDGTLAGTPGPGDVVTGSFPNIIISVTAGGDTVDLPGFTITVNAASAGGAVWDQFNWDDGSTWQ